MLLVVDIGNTNVTLGVFREAELLGNWRLSSARDRTEDEYALLISQLFVQAKLSLREVDGIMLASVVPPLSFVVERALKSLFHLDPSVVGPGTKTGMPILSDNPREVGADRIVNAVAAYSRAHKGLIVVDFGTATTFDVVSPKGEYLGGAISPGVGISAEALFLRAAKLPRIEFSAPSSAIGRNTVDAMRSGIVYGYVALVDGMVERIRKEFASPLYVVATGGYASLFAAHSKTIEECDPTLTLRGLRILHDLNHR